MCFCHVPQGGRKQATAALQALKGKPGDVGEAEDAASSTWAHARAALVLRTEGVSVALRWVSAAKAIQVCHTFLGASLLNVFWPS